MTEPTTRAAVTVRMSKATLWGLGVLATAVGVALGFLAAPLARWLVATVDGAPGPLKLLAALPTGWAVLVMGALGLVAGLLLAATAHDESLEVTVDADHVQLGVSGRARWIARADVDGVLRDGRDLVLLDCRGAELDRRRASDLPGGRLRSAFVDHGYPWRDDPAYGAGFATWVDGRPDLSAAVHLLLRERARAVERKDVDTAADLGAQLRSHGISVRDRDGRQEIRATG
jgi:hypothetical protein